MLLVLDGISGGCLFQQTISHRFHTSHNFDSSNSGLFVDLWHFSMCNQKFRLIIKWSQGNKQPMVLSELNLKLSKNKIMWKTFVNLTNVSNAPSGSLLTFYCLLLSICQHCTMCLLHFFCLFRKSLSGIR